MHRVAHKPRLERWSRDRTRAHTARWPPQRRGRDACGYGCRRGRDVVSRSERTVPERVTTLPSTVTVTRSAPTIARDRVGDGSATSSADTCSRLWTSETPERKRAMRSARPVYEDRSTSPDVAPERLDGGRVGGDVRISWMSRRSPGSARRWRCVLRGTGRAAMAPPGRKSRPGWA